LSIILGYNWIGDSFQGNLAKHASFQGILASLLVFFFFSIFNRKGSCPAHTSNAHCSSYNSGPTITYNFLDIALRSNFSKLFFFSHTLISSKFRFLFFPTSFSFPLVLSLRNWNTGFALILFIVLLSKFSTFFF